MENADMCFNTFLLSILTLVKHALSIIHIFVPIILIVFASISFFRLINNPEDKNGVKRIVNQFIAAVVVFFIPIILNVIMSLIGMKTYFSMCWNEASDKISLGTTYYDDGRVRKKIIYDSKNYEIGNSYNESGTAELAVKVVPTATPQGPLYTPKDYKNGGAWCKINDPRLYDYFKIMDSVIGSYPSHDRNNPARINGINNNNAYASCVQAVVGIVRATVDPDFESGSPALALEYLDQNTEKWNLVTRLPAGKRYDTACEPGDIIVLEGSSHFMLYVGNDLVREKFPNSNGNMYEASYSQNRYPAITHQGVVGGTYARIYRFTGKGTHYYPFIDVDKVLSGNVNFNKQMC